MKTFSINDLVNTNFNAVFLNSLRQSWRDSKTYQFFGNPKKHNLLLYINGYKIKYTDKNGISYFAGSGDIVYTALGSEYKVEITQEIPDSYTVGINFLLSDEQGEPISLDDNIIIFHPSDKTPSMLFHQALSLDIIKPALRNRILLLEILCSLVPYGLKKTMPAYIIKCTRYLSDNISTPTSIKSLAEFCGVSQVYLRKQFNLHLGMSPVKYKNMLRLNKAKDYIEYGDISVQEISDALGYSTVSHFIKEFRSHYDVSPFQYKKQLQNR